MAVTGIKKKEKNIYRKKTYINTDMTYFTGFLPPDYTENFIYDELHYYSSKVQTLFTVNIETHTPSAFVPFSSDLDIVHLCY